MSSTSTAPAVGTQALTASVSLDPRGSFGLAFVAPSRANALLADWFHTPHATCCQAACSRKVFGSATKKAAPGRSGLMAGADRSVEDRRT